MATKEKTTNAEEPRKIETTAWGNNYRYQDNYEQWKNNALVWTGHVAWLPERENITLNDPEKWKRFDLDRERNLNFPEKEVLQEATPPTENSWRKNIPWAKKNQQTQQTQQVTEPEWFVENGVRYKDATDRNAKTDWAEFGWLKNALPKEEVEVEEKVEEKTEEPKWQDVNVNTFLQWSTTELFGKMITWADTAPYDHNSTEWLKAEARLNQYQKINALSVPQLASSIKAWSILSGGQAMRDLQTYNPEKYQQLQEYQQKEDTLNQINMIASGNVKDSATNLQDKTWESINNYLSETVANAGWDALARMDLDTALSQNQWLINYAERMSYYQGQINQIDQTISNLAEDARKKLREATWENVLEYQVQNYVNNRSKKLYKQRENLMNQYNYYKWVYEAQIEEEATKWERDYKERQLKLQEDKAIRDQAIDQANLDLKNQQLNYDYYKLNASSPVSESAVQWWMTSYIDSIQDKIANHAKIRSWWCGTVVNDYLSSLGVKFQYDNNKSTKLNSITPWAWPKVGSIAVWESTGTTDWNKYWHVAIVTGVNKDGTITVLESNKDTWLRYHNYKQSNVTGYYDPSAWSKSTTTSKSSSKKEEKVYTNDENLTRLMQWKISYSDFVKDWQWGEFADEIEDYVWTNYFQKKPLMFMSDLKESVDALAKIFNQGWSTKEERENSEADAIQKAEMYTLEHLANNDKISNEAIMKQVKKYLDEVWNPDDEIVTYLSYALAWRYNDKKKLDNDLDVIWYKDSIWKKDRANAIWKIWKEDWIVK